jgi:hydrocephalus-inducing protein
VLDSIAMQAPLRQLTSHMLPLHNPLDAPVTFTASVNNAEVTVAPSITVDAGGKAELPIEWRPLLPKETTSQLSLASAELGDFNYDLRLQALPAGETKSMQYKCALGSLQTLRFRFLNFLHKPETYKLTIGSKAGDSEPVDFECEASVSAPAAEGSNGAEVAVDITFEPSSMRSSEALLTISSAEGGEYTCDLRGEALPPRPQGPIVIKAGASASVNFKNVFQQQAEFSFVCDSPAFTVAKPKEAVPPKKATAVAVSFKPVGEAKAGERVSGKLTVSTPEGFAQLYYLQGEV